MALGPPWRPYNTFVCSVRRANRVCGVSVLPQTHMLPALLLRSHFRSLIIRRQPERLESRFVGFLIEELPQARIVRILLVGDFDRLALFGEIIIGLRHVHRPYMLDR